MTPWTDRAGNFSPLKASVLFAVSLPAIFILWWAVSGGLGPRPITEAIHQTGDWAIRILIATLAVTPLRRILDWPKLIVVRRMLGVSALFYALTHLTLYALDQKWDLWKVASEIWLRTYLLIGFTALLGLIALGLTSFDRSIKALGRNWNRLHKIVYAIGFLAVIHYFMQTKLDVYQATFLAGLFILLMLYRLAHWRGYDIAKPLVLASVAIIGTVLTAAAELLWYATATGVPVGRVFQANFQFAFQIRPSWWVLAVGLGMALIALVLPLVRTKKEPRGRRAAAKAAA
ncbi:MAG TPA: protein-methionine-sulfoxide reductase heme-binding subunit MsrQ [Rhizobiaceae bacterium]|nr:protein-methionine-sulfoxide reductase heme-binding subunit MsrQ [Rhizobiaceae bacterium]